MKKKVALLLVLTMVLFAFAACGGGAQEEPPAEDNPPAAETVKTGLAVITSAAKSKDAGDENGLAQADSLVVAVTVDDAGKIVKCVIDQAQTKIEFSKEGKIVTPLDTVFVAKKEMGADYGMAKASGIGKEWNEQSDAFADYVAGKTVEEVKGIAVNEEGVPTGEDLTSSVTVHVTDFIGAIEKAVGNAQDLGASADDKLGLGVVTNIAKSKDAGEEDGVAQAY
jgi:predicted small lipoprotein YifL